MIRRLKDYIDLGFSFDEIEKIKFRQNGFGPYYKIKFNREYETPSEAFKNNAFHFEVLFYYQKRIKDEKSKLNLANSLITKDSKF